MQTFPNYIHESKVLLNACSICDIPYRAPFRTPHTFFRSVFYLSPHHLHKPMQRRGAQSSGLPHSIKPDCKSVPQPPAATGRQAGAQPPASTALNLVIAECNMATLAPLPQGALGGSKPGSSDADMGQGKVN